MRPACDLAHRWCCRFVRIASRRTRDDRATPTRDAHRPSKKQPRQSRRSNSSLSFDRANLQCLTTKPPTARPFRHLAHILSRLSQRYRDHDLQSSVGPFNAPSIGGVTTLEFVSKYVSNGQRWSTVLPRRPTPRHSEVTMMRQTDALSRIRARATAWVVDYSAARAKALAWLGDRYLLAQPVPRKSTANHLAPRHTVNSASHRSRAA